MTYKLYIITHHLPDSKDSYRRYNEEHNIFWDAMGPGMRQQFVDVTYIYRFVEHMG